MIEPPHAAPVDDGDDIRIVERELALLMRRVEQIRRNFVLDGVVLDRSAYLLLDRIDVLGSPTAGELATLLHLDHSTVTRQVGPLVRGGFVDRVRRTGGGPSRVLQLTSSGTALLEAARRNRHERVSAALAPWPEEDRRNLGRLLRGLNDVLG